MSKITIVHGPTSSGKSTLAGQIAEKTGARVLDEFGFGEDIVLVIAAGLDVEFVSTSDVSGEET